MPLRENEMKKEKRPNVLPNEVGRAVFESHKQAALWCEQVKGGIEWG